VTTEFDIVFDEICDDVFPKIGSYIDEEMERKELHKGYVDTYAVIEFLTDIEGYNTDMATKIWESYADNNVIHTSRFAPQ
jgi:hypothetical protein